MMTTAYTKEEIEKILKEEDFEYHSVPLPYGLCTPGDDRSPTRDLIFPESLANKTFLDVGSALGYFCFEAERRGASRVVGIELRSKRLRLAGILKDILGSDVEFVKKDLLYDPIEEKFDYICCLNVLHHLREPIRAIRNLALITREKLIIEFPTFSDKKFKKSCSIRFSFIYNKLPIIGVSSLANRSTDQTFVFTSSAIKRILLDHDSLFQSVKMIKSPIKGRIIAICCK